MLRGESGAPGCGLEPRHVVLRQWERCVQQLHPLAVRLAGEAQHWEQLRGGDIEGAQHLDGAGPRKCLVAARPPGWSLEPTHWAGNANQGTDTPHPRRLTIDVALFT